jgi:glycosyltransferase involved in cell wall biosynthesis/SAM-dependent methyltransferase
MKIAWVTPYNTRSAIGRFSRMIASGLNDSDHAVTIVRSEAADILDGSDGLPGTEVIRWDEVCYAPDFWSPFDAVVYNIGDHYPFHAGVIETLYRFPGVVIFHDYFLLDLFSAWREAIAGQAFADRILDNLYGEGAAVRFHAAASRADWYEYTSEHFPMTEWIARLSYGAVAHSSFYADRLRRCCGGPVLVTPLAYDALSDFQPLAGRDERPTVVILTIGHVNENKRIESVIRAIGSSDVLRNRCHYHVAGLVSDQERERLTAVAQTVSFDGLQIAGEVSNETLRAEIEAADVICCLRWPVLEGASASAVEAMLSGRPVIVTDAGFYRDLPDDLVFRVDPKYELGSLTSQLTRLVLDPALRATTGARAAEWAKSAFSVEGYVGRLVPLLEEVARLRPVLRAAAHFGQLFSELGLEPNDPAVERLATTLDSLFMKNAPAKIPPTTMVRSRGELEQQTQPVKWANANKRGWRYPTLTEVEISAYQQRINEITNRCQPSGWFHSLELGNGLFAPGHIPIETLHRNLEWMHFPEDLWGQSFIDLGSWDGFYAFEAEQRRAARVLATDWFCWHGAGWGNKEGFLLAREILGSKVEDMDIDIMDVCPQRVGLFDVVLFSGMLYHMRDPIKAIQNAASVCKKRLIVETAVGMEQLEEPAMAYLPRVPGQDQSNYWRPNPPLVNLWLKELGFKKTEHHVISDRGFFNAVR